MCVVRDSNLTAMRLMMQVFVDVTWCTRPVVSTVLFEHSTYIFKCPTIQEELTLCSSETNDTTQPKTWSNHRRPESSSWFCL